MSARYLTPFGFLALLPLGYWLGGPWTFAAAAATVVCMPALDFALGEHCQRKSVTGASPKWFPRIYIVAQLGITAWMALIVSQPATSPLEGLGLAASCGVTTGVFGFLAAHEMIHSRNRGLRFLGLAMLASALYMHFRIAHLTGHHRRAATDADPTSARLGEGLYDFILRSVAGQIREAWVFETARLRRARRSVLGTGNRVAIYLAIEAAMLVALGVVSWRSLAFVVTTAIIAVFLLEAFNYVAHYGLRREVRTDGSFERLTPSHSWNSKRRMDNAALFNMGCHSDHHSHPARSFDRLEPAPQCAELPFGYGTALLTALVPPLWRQIMEKRVIDVRGR